MSLANLTQPNKVGEAGCVGMASSLSENREPQDPDERHVYKWQQGHKCERHYAWNYHLSTRLAFSHEVRRGTMSLDGTDVGNGKVVTCVVGDMDRDLHGWAPPMDPTYVIEI